MRAYEFPAKLTPDRKIEVADIFLKNLPVNQTVRIILLVNEPDDIQSEEDQEKEAADWARLGAEQLFAGYSPEDAIYDNL